MLTSERCSSISLNLKSARKWDAAGGEHRLSCMPGNNFARILPVLSTPFCRPNPKVPELPKELQQGFVVHARENRGRRSYAVTQKAPTTITGQL